ncbi:MAG: energy transducer TonB [Opitutaceae bacterium]|nr:energy transducer TonB [Opitutaceae bacterium]
MRNLLVFSPLLVAAFLIGCSKKQTTELSDSEKEVVTQETVIEEAPQVSFNRNSEMVQTESSDETLVVAEEETQAVQMVSPDLQGFYYPFYPLSLRMSGVEGTVLLEFVVDQKGSVVDPKIVSSTEPRFNTYALEAIRESTFIPGMLNGKNIDFPVEFPISYLSEFGSGEMAPDSIFNHLIYNFGTYYVKTPEGHELAELEVTPILRQEPVFPEEMEVSGMVNIRFTITKEGQVQNPEVIESSHPEFEQSALTAIRFWQFIPRIRGGKPVQIQMEMPISFKYE